MALPPGMIEFDARIMPKAKAMSFSYLDYAAVKVCKRLCVTVGYERNGGAARKQIYWRDLVEGKANAVIYGEN